MLTTLRPVAACSARPRVGGGSYGRRRWGFRVAMSENKLPSDPPAVAALESTWPLHSQQPTHAPGAARPAAPQATSLSTAAGNAQPEDAKQRYGHRHITTPQKIGALMFINPSTPPAPPRCRSEPEAPQGSPARPESAAPATPPHRQALGDTTAADQRWALDLPQSAVDSPQQNQSPRADRQTPQPAVHAARQQRVRWP